MESLATLKARYLKAKQAYYNREKTIMTDAQFDALEDQIKSKAPNWSELKKTGVTIANKKVEVELRQFMPSLNKAYPPAFPSWIAKNPSDRYIAMHKIDGTSLLLTMKDGVAFKLVTRGNGILGKDISFLLPALNIPTFRKSKGLVDLRLEAVISKAKYKKWASEFDDPRSMVNGIFNRRVPHPAMNDVDLVVLGRYGHSVQNSLDQLSGQLKPVPFELITAKKMSVETASALLSKARKSGDYEVDGLVIAPSDFLLSYQDAEKPKHIVAFKVNDAADMIPVTVEKIIWQITGRRRIVPKIYIKATKIGGVMVNHAAAHNAKWMTDRDIGPGAVVNVVRSGGVIPTIDSVVKAGKFQGPGVAYKVKGVHFVLDEQQATVASNLRVNVLNICKFCKTLKIDLIAGKTATAIYHTGLTSPLAYVIATKRGQAVNFLAEAGFTGLQGKKIVAELEHCFNATVSMRKLMVAFQCFGVGIGDRKLSMVEAAGISMSQLTMCKSKKEVHDLLIKVPGFDTKTISVVNEGMSRWKGLLVSVRNEGVNVDGNLPPKSKTVKGSLTGQVFAWTGYRAPAEEAKITAAGGVVGSLSSKTTTLFYNPEGKFMDKVEKARAKGINCVVFSKFKGV